jgi:uracil-DNA glycosylase
MKNVFAPAIAIALLFGAACSRTEPYNSRHISSSKDRGNPWEYDAGAPKDSKWPDLFASTPNYRAFGQEVIQGVGDKFRWIFGPMWYRGRLEKQQVKIFVIGQEGAQDENVSNRSFTGSTGTRMQKFLNYLGVDRSYLFMNTFVYTITGQYSLFGEDRTDPKKLKEQERLLWLAQDQDSVVVKHRHELFDYMLSQNKGTLALVIGVGTAGKDSAATWVRSHGGKCSASTLSRGSCSGAGELAGVKVIGVAHPGAASARNGGEDAAGALVKDFRSKADIVSSFIKSNSSWLPLDPGMERDFSKPFRYGHAAIPHRDFAFGTTWVMGKNGTASNRRGQNTIQIFSENGCYNNVARIEGRCTEEKTQNIRYDDPKSLLSSAPSEMKAGDVPYENSKNEELRRQYDEGPGKFARLLLEYYDQPYWDLGLTMHESLGHAGIYRGRFENAKLLVIADQESQDDMFSGRALTGTGGQLFQSFLTAAGATESYLILRTLPIDSADLSVEKRTEAALDSRVSAAREEIINQVLKLGNTQAIISVGPTAKAVVEKLAIRNMPIFNLNSFDSSGHEAQWNSELKKLKAASLSLDTKPSATYSGKISIIPRADLPAYTRWWMGTSGSRAARGYEIISGKRVESPDYYKVYAPTWASRWRTSVKDLSKAELDSLKIFKETELAR